MPLVIDDDEPIVGKTSERLLESSDGYRGVNLVLSHVMNLIAEVRRGLMFARFAGLLLACAPHLSIVLNRLERRCAT